MTVKLGKHSRLAWMRKESQAPQVLKHKYKVYKLKYKAEKKPSSRSGKFSAAVLLI